jgi:hypothetical protein
MTLDDSAADAAEPIDREEEEDRVAAESLAAGDPTGWFEQPNRPRRETTRRGRIRQPAQTGRRPSPPSRSDCNRAKIAQ